MKFFDLFKMIDLFSIPFQYNIGEDKKTNKTIFGAILSLLIGLSSLAYLLYLFSFYVNNEIQPSVSIIHNITQQSYKMSIEEDFIKLKIILSNGKNLIEYEKEQGKSYLLFGIELKYKDSSNKLTKEYFKMLPCKNSEIKDYYCINFRGQLDQGVFLNYNNEHEIQDKLTLLFAPCQNAYLTQGQICETNKDTIKKLIINMENDIRVQIKLKQFNTLTKGLEDKFKAEKFIFDKELAFISSISLKKNDLKIMDGFIVQSSRSYTHLNDYSRMDTNASQQYLSEFYQIDILGAVIFLLGEYNTSTSVQYTPFTSLLAQFSSVFNSLLILGYFCKKVSQAEIVTELVQIQLQIKYKQIALDLLQKHQPINDLKPQEVYKKISNFVFNNQLFTYFGLGYLKRMKLFSDNTLDLEKSKNVPKQQEILFKLLNRTQNSLNIYEVQKQLIEIQIMLKILFSEQQYAAIKFCGNNLNEQFSSNLPKLTQRNSSYRGTKVHQDENITSNSLRKKEYRHQISNICDEPCKSLKNLNIEPQENQQIQENFNQETQEEIQINHLDKLEKVDRDEQYFEKQFLKFLYHIQNDRYNHSEIDKRIFDSMISYGNISNKSIH